MPARRRTMSSMSRGSSVTNGSAAPGRKRSTWPWKSCSTKRKTTRRSRHGDGSFPCEKPKEFEILCLLTGNSRVRIERVGPRKELELLTIWLTRTLKKAGFWWFFSGPRRAHRRSRSDLLRLNLIPEASPLPQLPWRRNEVEGRKGQASLAGDGEDSIRARVIRLLCGPRPCSLSLVRTPKGARTWPTTWMTNTAASNKQL